MSHVRRAYRQTVPGCLLNMLKNIVKMDNVSVINIAIHVSCIKVGTRLVSYLT